MLGPAECFVRGIGHGDHVAPTVAVPADWSDRLTDLEVRVRLHDALRRKNGVEASDPEYVAGGQWAGVGRP